MSTSSADRYKLYCSNTNKDRCLKLSGTNIFFDLSVKSWNYWKNRWPKVNNKIGNFSWPFYGLKFLVLESYYLYLSAHKIAGQNLIKLKNGSKFNIFYKQTEFFIHFKKYVTLLLVFPSFDSIFSWLFCKFKLINNKMSESQ